MRKSFTILLASVLVVSCSAEDGPEKRGANQIVAENLIRNSVLACSDGNQIRVSGAGFTPGGVPMSNSTYLAVWPVLDQNGKPKTCGPPTPPPPVQTDPRANEVPVQ